MNNYELALVLNARIEDDERTALLERVKEYITRFGGEIKNIDEWGKKLLAYEIQKMREGYYYFIHFTSDTAAPAQIEENIRIIDGILRFLIIRQDEK